MVIGKVLFRHGDRVHQQDNSTIRHYCDTFTSGVWRLNLSGLPTKPLRVSLLTTQLNGSKQPEGA